MSAISRDEVTNLAKLARIALSDAELDSFAGQLDSILEHVKVVTELGGSDIAPLILPEVGNTRADVVVPGLPRESALAAAPAVAENRFQVPQILGEE